MKSVIPREIETFWTLFTGPTVWALHFLACYVAMAIYCAKPGIMGLDFNGFRWLLGTLTAASLAFIVFAGYLAWRQWGFGTGDPPHDEPTADSRRLFQGFATLLLCGLSFVAVFYTSVPLIFLAECQS